MIAFHLSNFSTTIALTISSRTNIYFTDCGGWQLYIV